MTTNRLITLIIGSLAILFALILFVSPVAVDVPNFAPDDCGTILAPRSSSVSCEVTRNRRLLYSGVILVGGLVATVRAGNPAYWHEKRDDQDSDE